MTEINLDDDDDNNNYDSQAYWKLDSSYDNT